MKKFLSIFIVIAMIMMGVAVVAAPTSAVAQTSVNGCTPLIAGQHITVGQVCVWNDSDNLYVQYEITEPGWCLDETHLAVATSLEDIPHTKKGNPIPGLFPYSHENLGCVSIDLYTIPLEKLGVEECGTSLYIAAHAVVYNGDGSETAWGGKGERFVSRGNWAMYFNYSIKCGFEKDEDMYIGYEDLPNGDFDYNDFGMYLGLSEHYYYWGPTSDKDLTKVVMTFTAEVYDSGMDHLIHIKRPIVGSSIVIVSRSVSAYTGETPAGIYSFSGDVDIVLFNTAKYFWPSKQIGETVTVEIMVGDPSSNPEVTPTAPRWDLNSMAFMANYDPYEVGSRSGSLWHIGNIQTVANTASCDPSLFGLNLPYILVVPVKAWIPPFEGTTITGPYGYFDDYYNTTGASHPNWYNEITNGTVGPGGLSW